jgi:hypothetical protein
LEGHEGVRTKSSWKRRKSGSLESMLTVLFWINGLCANSPVRRLIALFTSVITRPRSAEAWLSAASSTEARIQPTSDRAVMIEHARGLLGDLRSQGHALRRTHDERRTARRADVGVPMPMHAVLR